MSAAAIGPVKAMVLSLERRGRRGRGRRDCSRRRRGRLAARAAAGARRTARRAPVAAAPLLPSLSQPAAEAPSLPMTPNANLDLILRRHEEIGARLAEGVAGAEYAQLSRELSPNSPPGRRDHPGIAREAEGASPTSPPCSRIPRPTPRCARSPSGARDRRAPRRPRWRRRSGSRCCPGTPPTMATSSSRCARAPAATRPRCSPAISSACI